MSGLRWLDLPPVWLALAAGVMWLMARWVPLAEFEPLTWAGRALILGALVLIAWAAVTMHRARTTIIPHLAPEALVTSGPFRFTRNPIYLADAAILTGWWLQLGALSPVAMVPVFCWIVTRRFIRDEEARLAAAFPDAFAAYRARVRRWG